MSVHMVNAGKSVQGQIERLFHDFSLKIIQKLFENVEQKKRLTL